MGRSVGIDLGTTFSAISTTEAGEPVIIANAEGFRTTPSIVAFSKTGDVLVGETAKRQAVTNVERTISSVKRHMGEKWVKEIDGKSYTPEEISARILQKLKKDVEAYLGEEVTDAVITVPAYFENAQKEATLAAGRIAGLNVLRIINEPTAAALSYGADKGKEDENLVVVDIGGGTADFSYLVTNKDEDGFITIETVAVTGDNFLGGDDWDKALMDYIVSRFKDQTGVDLSNDKIAMQRIKEAAEQAKKELSTGTSTTVQLPYISLSSNGPLNLEETITRATFESITKPVLERVRKPLKQLLEDGELTPEKIHHVLLVGGSTRMPAIANLVKELTGKEPEKTVHPDEAVALGASIQASVLKGERKDVLLIDNLPISVGIEVNGGVFVKMIERNSAIPTQRSEVFANAADNQRAVTIQVFTGEREFTRDNKLLGRFDLPILPSKAGTAKINVTFNIDANGILHVTAKDEATGKDQSITITNSSNLSEEEIERMIRDAELHASEDKAKRELVDAKNTAERLIYSTNETLKEYGDKVPANVKDEVEAAVSELRPVAEGESLSAINEAIERLNAALTRIGESVYGSTSSQTGSTQPDDAGSEDVVDAEIVDEDK